MATSAAFSRARLLVLVLFACVRLGHLLQVQDAPALAQQQWPDSDMFAFDHWAHHIADGDLLSRLPQRPLTSWNRDVVAAWQQLHPGQPPADAEALWRHWQGGARFYQEPLFAYALAALYATVGSSPLLALALQALLGALGLWLLIDAARRLLGEREAILAGILATLCGPLAYYESLLLRETLAVTTVWLLLRQWAVARERPTWRPWAALGLAAGLALLTRMTIAPLVVGLIAVSLLPATTRWPRALGWTIGMSLPLGAVLLRNASVGAPLGGLGGGGGIYAFVMANSRFAEPWQGWVVDPPLIARLLAQSDGANLPLALATLSDHPSLGSVLALQAAKWSPLLHAFEVPSNSSFAFYREHAPILRFLPVDFAIALPLGLVGAWRAWVDRRARVLVALSVVQLLPVLILQPLSRFRLGLLVALLPLAALALVWLYDAWRAGERRRVGVAAVAVLALCGWMHRPLPPDVAPTRAVDHAVAWQFWALPDLQHAAARGDHAAVAEAMRLFLRGEPEELASWPRALRREQTQIAERYSEAHNIAAQAEQLLGHEAQAAVDRAASSALHRLNRR